MHLSKIGMIIGLFLFLTPLTHAASRKRVPPPDDCASSLITEDIQMAIRQMQKHKRLTEAYEQLSLLFPKDLSKEDMSNVLTLADFDSDAITFLNHLCASFKGKQRTEYLRLMVAKSVFGRVIPKFAKFIDGDFDYGHRLLKQDDPIVDEIIVEALDERFYN